MILSVLQQSSVILASTSDFHSCRLVALNWAWQGSIVCCRLNPDLFHIPLLFLGPWVGLDLLLVITEAQRENSVLQACQASVCIKSAKIPLVKAYIQEAGKGTHNHMTKNIQREE